MGIVVVSYRHAAGVKIAPRTLLASHRTVGVQRKFLSP